MKLNQNKQQLRQSSESDLKNMLAEERKNLFMGRRDSVTRQLENPKRIKQIRKNIARILTIMRERELESAEARK
jgi:large subunit ribosomal protein L29